MQQDGIYRRSFLGGAVALAGAVAPGAVAAREAGDAFGFEVMRSEAEWRARLTEAEYAILREGGTEPKRSSPLWQEERPGIYRCKGCDLTLYDAYWKRVLDIGWVFFRHAEPFAVLTAIDRPDYAELLTVEGSTMVPELTAEEIRALDELAGVEAVCRRCGSHLGHIVSLEGGVMHCINGAALDFRPSDA